VKEQAGTKNVASFTKNVPAKYSGKQEQKHAEETKKWQWEREGSVATGTREKGTER
jgi:hypothetical protein